MTQLFSFTPSFDNEHTSHTCSNASFPAHHPQCIVECSFCNPGMKRPPNCITHNSLKKMLNIEEGKQSDSIGTDVPNNVCKLTQNNVKMMKATRSSTPTLQQVKVNPDPKKLPLLNNVR